MNVENWMPGAKQGPTAVNAPPSLRSRIMPRKVDPARCSTMRSSSPSPSQSPAHPGAEYVVPGAGGVSSTGGAETDWPLPWFQETASTPTLQSGSPSWSASQILRVPGPVPGPGSHGSPVSGAFAK